MSSTTGRQGLVAPKTPRCPRIPTIDAPRARRYALGQFASLWQSPHYLNSTNLAAIVLRTASLLSSETVLGRLMSCLEFRDTLSAIFMDFMNNAASEELKLIFRIRQRTGPKHMITITRRVEFFGAHRRTSATFPTRRMGLYGVCNNRGPRPQYLKSPSRALPRKRNVMDVKDLKDILQKVIHDPAIISIEPRRPISKA